MGNLVVDRLKSMVTSKQPRQLLVEAVITAGVIGIVPTLASNPILLPIAFMCTNMDLSAGLIGRAIEYFVRNLLKSEKHGFLNHDVQKALLSAFQDTMDEMKNHWKQDKQAYEILRNLQRDARVQTKHNTDLLKNLLSDEELKKHIGDEQSIQATLGDKNKLQVVSNDIIEKVLPQHEKLHKYLKEKLVERWVFYFRERLKNPETGTEAWRAYILLYHESLQKSVEEIQSEIAHVQREVVGMRQGEISEISKNVKETNQKITHMQEAISVFLENTENSEHGQLLAEVLHPVHINLSQIAGNLQSAATNIDQAATRTQEAAHLAQQAAEKIEEAFTVCVQTIDTTIGEKIGDLRDEIDRLEGFTTTLSKMLDAYTAPIFSVLLTLPVTLLIHWITQDNYKGHVLIWAWITGILLISLLGYTAQMYYPWKSSHSGVFSMLFVIALGSMLWYVVPATANELFPEQMKGSVNIVIADFVGEEGKTISEFIYLGIDDQIFEKSHLPRKEIKLRRHKAIHTGEEAQSIAKRFDANIVVWGGKIDQDFYHSRFYVRDPVEGGLDIAVRFNVPADAGTIVDNINERTSITVVFITGLTYLFQQEPLALQAINEFDRAINLAETTEQGEGGDLGDIEYVLYFFKGRSHAVIGQDNEALAAYNKTLELNPEYTWAYIGRGNVYFDRATQTSPANVELMEKALGEYSTAIQVHQGPANNLPSPIAYVPAKAFVNVGNIYSIFVEESDEDDEFDLFALQSTDAYSRALETYTKIGINSELTIEGRYLAQPHYGLGVVYALEGDRYMNGNNYQDAIKEYDTCIELAKSDPNQERAEGIKSLCEEEKEKVNAKLQPST